MDPIRLVALGSSFAAGPGITPIIDRRAMRSSCNYAHLLATKLQAELIDLTSSGATLLNVLNEPQSYFALTSSLAPPQLDGIPQDADIVTITAGGNDLFYSGGMIIDALKASLGKIPLFGGWLTSFFLRASPRQSSLSIEDLSSRFLAVIDKINAVCPKATIVLVEYVTVFSATTRVGAENPLSDAQMQHYRDVATVLQSSYRQAAAARPAVRLLPMSTRSAEHGVGTLTPWVSGFSLLMFARGLVPYHPNALGHEMVAQELYDLLAGKVETPPS